MATRGRTDLDRPKNLLGLLTVTLLLLLLRLPSVHSFSTTFHHPSLLYHHEVTRCSSSSSCSSLSSTPAAGRKWHRIQHGCPFTTFNSKTTCQGWVQGSDGEWEWEEDDSTHNMDASTTITTTTTATTATMEIDTTATATPQLPSGKLKPKQSLGQNFLKDPNTVAKMIKAFHQDATVRRPDAQNKPLTCIVELGPGAGALTDRLVDNYGTDVLQCIEVDPRAVDILAAKHPSLKVHLADVLQVNYPAMAQQEGQPLVIIGNLPYYITSQILFALADASHYGAVDCATVTMQWEVAQRMVAPPSQTKDYGILSVVFQTYADVHCHFKIPPTVFYPQPKVDSALVGLHFLGPTKLRQRLAGVQPKHFRQVVTTAFRQRRKTIRNSLKKLQLPRPELKHHQTREEEDDDDGDDDNDCDDDDADVVLMAVDKNYLLEKLNSLPVPLPAQVLQNRERGDPFAQTQELPDDWASKRPEQLTPGQFVEITRLLFGDTTLGNDKDECKDYNNDLGRKVWRKLKHGI